MDDVELFIRRAWEKLAPTLRADPDELRRRRDSATLRRPPRAWCLAIRASDTRLAPYMTRIPDFGQPNAVLLDSPALKKLCAPVRLDPPGETVSEVAHKLGVSYCGLRYPRLKGVFHVHHIHGRGIPKPLLYSPHELDPSSRLFRPSDPIWSWTATFLTTRIPDNLQASLIRVPVITSLRQQHRHADLHPEHPKRDPPPKNNQRLPPPQPDYVWYKWKGDQFIGYDWRADKSGRMKAGYERAERRRKLERESAARRRRENPPPSKSKGSLRNWGWRWICPKCQKRVNVLYYPLPPLQLFIPAASLAPSRSGDACVAVSSSYSSTIHNPPSTIHAPSQTFACHTCHQIKHTSSWSPIGWNEVVSYLTAGLLFGHEVPRPAHLSTTRKKPYKPLLNARPAKRRAQIEKLLLSGLRPYQIAPILGTTPEYISNQARIIYKGERLISLKQFFKKHKVPYPKLHRPRRADGKFLPTGARPRKRALTPLPGDERVGEG